MCIRDRPDIVDLFGMSEDVSESTQETEEIESKDDEAAIEEESGSEIQEPVLKEKSSSVDDDIDSFFG